MAAFTLIIKDNETNEENVIPCDAIIGAASCKEEGHTAVLINVKCATDTIASAMDGAQDALDSAKKHFPKANALLALKSLFVDDEDEGDEEAEEEGNG